MNKAKRWTVTILVVCGLLLGLSSVATMQDREAQLMEANRLNQQVIQLYQAGRYPEAIPLAERALAIREKVLGPEHPYVAELLNNLAELHREQGDYGRATPLYQRALAIKEKEVGPEHPDVATLLSNLALLYHEQGDYKRAVPLHRRALEVTERTVGPRHPDFATSLSNLALSYHALGKYEQAVLLHRRALVISMEVYGSKHPDIVVSLNNLASSYQALGDNKLAAELSQRALEVAEELWGANHPNHPNIAQSLNNLASVYRDQGAYRRAVPLYERALAIAEKVEPEHPNVATLLNNLAMSYQALGDYKRSVSLHERALAIRLRVLKPEHPDIAESLSNLASWYKDQGDYGQAVSLYQRALAICEKAFGSEHPHVAESLSNLAALHQAQREYGRAISFLQQSQEIEEKNLLLVLNAGSHQQKQLYLNKISGGAYAAVSLHTQHMPQNTAAARLAFTAILRRKGRALDASTDQLAALRSRVAPEDQKLLDQLVAAQSQLARLRLSDAGQLSPAAQQLEMELLEDAISRRSKEFHIVTQPVTLDAVRQAVPTDAALVELLIYAPVNAAAKTVAGLYGTPRYVAYVLRPTDDTPQFVNLGEAALIDAEAKRLREALKDSKRADVQTLARTMDEQVMHPIRKLLGQTRRIFLSPDGALNLIPFAALVDENGKYLIENYSLTYLTSGRDLLRMQAQADSRNAPMILANPLYDMPTNQHANLPSTQSDENQRSLDFTLLNYKPLPGTAEEAAALGRLWPDVQVLTQDKATESALKQVRGPRILHIATHGFFLTDQPRELPVGDRLRRATIDPASLPKRLEDPLLRSGLVLAGVKQQQSGAGEDGVLTALETAGLDLWGTKLVVLSACETGLGDVRNGVGVYGLRRALVLAGSQTQIMSLWKVSDAGTRDLMVAYYTRLQAGEGRTEALRQVQLAMLRGELKSTQNAADYRHPYYWAAFIPSGDWRRLETRNSRGLPLILFPVISGLIVFSFFLLWWLSKNRRLS